MLRKKKLLAVGLAGIWMTASLFGGAGTVRAEQVGNAQNTDGGEITIHFTHCNAQELTFDLGVNNGELAYTDAVLTYQDSTMDEPISLSLLSPDGSYTLYDLPEPVEELSGTFSISMVTKPGYSLDLSQTTWNVNGQPVSDGGYVVITSSTASMNSTVSCGIIPEQTAEETADPSVEEEALTPEPVISQTQQKDLPDGEGTEKTPVKKAQTEKLPSESGQMTETAALSQSEQTREAAYLSQNETVSASISSPAPLHSVPIVSDVSPEAKEAEKEPSFESRTILSEPAGSEITVDVKESQASSATKADTFSMKKLLQNTNLVLAVMVLVIAVLILFELLRSLLWDIRQKRCRRTM